MRTNLADGRILLYASLITLLSFKSSLASIKDFDTFSLIRSFAGHLDQRPTKMPASARYGLVVASNSLHLDFIVREADEQELRLEGQSLVQGEDMRH